MTEPHLHSHAEHEHVGHAGHARAGHAHGAHVTSPATVPVASMRWSVLSLSVVQRVLLVVPMVACLWLAVGWAISS